MQAVGAALSSRDPDGRTATWLAFALAAFPAGIADRARRRRRRRASSLVAGLIAFGVVFALNSAVHSYLILAYADGDKVAMNVGFYYMANAGGRLAGTVLSGVLYQWQGLEACLWASAAFVLAAGAAVALAAQRAVGAQEATDGPAPRRRAARRSGPLEHPGCQAAGVRCRCRLSGGR